MFCPVCGKAEQTPETYCRKCGAFLLDYSGNASLITRIFGANTPEKRVSAGLVFDALTLVFSMLLLIFLFGYFDALFTRTGETAPPIIYLVYIFLGAISLWQIFSLIVGISHKNRLRGRKIDDQSNAETIQTAELNEASKIQLPPANYENLATPPSVIGDTTKHLDKIPRR